MTIGALLFQRTGSLLQNGIQIALIPLRAFTLLAGVEQVITVVLTIITIST